MNYVLKYRKEVLIVMFEEKHSDISGIDQSTITFLR
jgi:hypothetical protein